MRVIGRVEEFEVLSPRWDDLARRADATPFMLSGYLSEVWRRTSWPVFCVVAECGDRLVGGLPLRIRGRPWAREAALLAAATAQTFCATPASRAKLRARC